jgi:rhodanese-related sulfurtransferase
MFSTKDSALKTQEEFMQLLSDREDKKIEFKLIDVREHEEYDNARIDGVDFLMPSTIIGSFLEELKELNTQIVIYCRTDRRSKQVHEYLSKNGIKSYYIKGGITDYKGKII